MNSRNPLLLLLFVALAACSNASNTSDPVLNDGLGSNNPGNNNPGNNGPGNNGQNNLTPSDVSVVINEIAAAGDPIDWVELYNFGDDVVHLTNFTLTDDPAEPRKGLVPAGLSVAPGAFVVIEIADETVGFKIGGDEELHLFDADGDAIDTVDWEEGDSPEGLSFGRLPDSTGEFVTTAPTPGEANQPAELDECGDGVCGPTEDFDACSDDCNEPEPECGDDVCDDGETCPEDCGAEPANVVINEIAAAGDPDDWFELVNLGDAEVDLTDWTFSDDPAAEPNKGSFSAGTMIAPGEYLLIVVADDTVGFKLGGDEELGLFDSAGSLVDHVDWDEGDSPEGGSFGRTPDGTGEFETLTPDTMGQPNLAREETGLVINEVAAAGEPEDWLELYNGTASSIDLSGWTITDDIAGEPAKQRLTDLTIGPWGFLVIEPEFGMGSDEELGLFDTEGNLVDMVDWEDGDSPEGGSLGRTPSGTGDFQTTQEPTRGF